MSNVLDPYDQTYFSFGRAAGVTNLLQCVWVYDRGINVDGVRTFHHHLQQGLLARRIERSRLPFGRDRWVSSSRAPELEMVATPRSRVEFDAWLDEQADIPLDPEHGPGWHLAVLPFADGGAGLSLTVSHCLIDGVGLSRAVADAASGGAHPTVWPPAGSRGRWQAIAEDAVQSVRDMPAVARAVVAAATFVRRQRGAAPTQTTAVDESDERVTLSTTTIFVNAEHWDARANALGGTANTLLAGMAARLALKVGRTTADGSATPSIPVNTRREGDTRANAITNVDITVDPMTAGTDLNEIRTATKQALIRSKEVPDERWALLPLVPLLPEQIKKRVVGVVTGGTTNVVSSNLGATAPELNKPDGTDADYFAMKSLYPGVTQAIMHRTGGVLALLSGRVDGRVFVSALAYQPGRKNSDGHLRQDLSSVLQDFSIAALTDWGATQMNRQYDRAGV